MNERKPTLETLDREIAKKLLIRGLARGNAILRLRDKRKALGISLGNMAQRVGCSKPFLSDVEHGRRWSDRIVAAYATTVQVEI